VKRATRFILNVVLRLPFREDDVEIIPAADALCLHFNLKSDIADLSDGWTSNLHQKLKRFFADSRTLHAFAIQNWFRDIIAAAAESCKVQLADIVDSFTIPTEETSFTYSITYRGTKLKLDLVPVIAGSYTLPTTIVISSRVKSLQPSDKIWVLVPKFCNRNDMIQNSVFETTWRLSFPEAEKELFHVQGCFKKIIKLFKLLKDTQSSWLAISSYHIKTLFLLELDQNPTYWNEIDFGMRFMEMLKKLKSVISHKSLPDYFNRNENLLSEMEDSAEIANRMTRMILDIERTPSHVVSYFP